MKIKSNLMLREIAGQWIVVPLGERTVEFNAIMSLSESGAELWRLLEQGAQEPDLLAMLLREFDVAEDIAAADLKEFLSTLNEKGLLA